MRCLIVTSNMVEAEDLRELLTCDYAMTVHTYRDIQAARAEIEHLDRIALMFLSVEFAAQDMADAVQDVLALDAKIILINGSDMDMDGAVGALSRPYSSQDIARLMAGLA